MTKEHGMEAASLPDPGLTVAGDTGVRAGLGLGTARLGAFWQGKGVREGARALDAAFDLGVTVVDTADVYARGISERLVGRALRRHEGVTVITKGGLLKTPAALAQAARSGAGRPSAGGLRAAAPAGRCFRPDYLRWAVQGSLRRLGLDSLPVYLLHEPDLATVRDPEVVAGMERLREEGAVGAWGVSTPEDDVALAAMDLPGTPWIEALVGPGNDSLAEKLTVHPRRRESVLVGIGALGDGGQVARRAAVGRMGPAEAVASLAAEAVDRAAPDLLLLGMSTREHVRRNVARLMAAPEPAGQDKKETAG